jgi:multidrug efflux pump subunit AcrA (membrane-fusion protein)
MDVVAECRAVARPLTNEVRILADRSGYLEQVFVQAGQDVEKDAPLFLIRAREPLAHEADVKRIKVEQTRSSLASAESEAAFWENEIQRLTREVGSMADLLKNGIVSARDYNDAKSKLEKAQNEGKKAAGQKSILLDEMRILEAGIKVDTEESVKTIRTEQAGTIAEVRFKNKGEFIQPSDLLCTIVPSDSPLTMDITVANKDIGLIEPGMAVKYKFEAFPYREYGILRGQVKVIPPSASEDKTLGFVYLVQGDVTDPSYERRGKTYRVKAGMTAVAELITERKSIFALLFKKAGQGS